MGTTVESRAFILQAKLPDPRRRAMANPLSRRQVLKYGAFTTVGGVLTPGVSLAQASFYAIAPELYFREGGMQGKDFQQMSQISGNVTRAQYLGDLRAAADYAKQQSWARADRVGVTGFCGGGAPALHFAAEYPGVAAAVPWYGHLKRTFSDAPGVDAFSLADKIKAPVLGLYGEADPGIPADDVKRFEAELKKRGVAADFIFYPGAPHAFFSDDRPQVYKKEASEDAWKRCVAFFDKQLKA